MEIYEMGCAEELENWLCILDYNLLVGSLDFVIESRVIGTKQCRHCCLQYVPDLRCKIGSNCSETPNGQVI